jgi:hypothetical protein
MSSDTGRDWRASKATSSGLAVMHVQDTLELLADIGIAFARLRFQLRTVENPYMTPTVLQQARFPKACRHNADTWTVASQHVGQILMGQDKFLSLHPIMGKQHPPRKPLFKGVLAVASD